MINVNALEAGSATGGDRRFDVIVKFVELEPSGRSQSLTLKYDYKLNQNWGLNFELPAYTKLSVPGLSRSGNGDLFARARWIVPAGAWTYGASFETVLPVASRDELGTGRYQLNVGGLVVRAFSSSFIAAAVLKQATSVGGDSARVRFSNTDFRRGGAGHARAEPRRTVPHGSGAARHPHRAARAAAGPDTSAVAAFAFLPLHFLWRGDDARRAEAWPAVMLLVGTAFGAAQLLRGAHYVSPALGSGWLCWTGGLLAAGPAPRVGGPLPSEPAALD